MENHDAISKLHERIDRTDDNIATISNKITEHDIILHGLEKASNEQTHEISALNVNFGKGIDEVKKIQSESQKAPYNVIWAAGAVLVAVIAGLYSLASAPMNQRLDRIDYDLHERGENFQNLTEQARENAANFAALHTKVDTLTENHKLRYEGVRENLKTLEGNTKDRYTRTDAQRMCDEVDELRKELSYLQGQLHLDSEVKNEN